MLVEVICDFCGKEFEKLYGEIGRRTKGNAPPLNFCCRKCYFEYRAQTSKKNQKIKLCTSCGKEIIVKPGKKIYNTCYCSRECQEKLWRKKKEELIGKVYGRCKVLSIQSIKGYYTHYLLKCDCGEKFIRREYDIKNGLVFECPNCVFRRSEYYIGGKKFGRLHVLDEWDWHKTPNGHKYRIWKCKCECGKETWVPSDAIKSGHTVSCGCYMVRKKVKKKTKKQQIVYERAVEKAKNNYREVTEEEKEVVGG